MNQRTSIPKTFTLTLWLPLVCLLLASTVNAQPTDEESAERTPTGVTEDKSETDTTNADTSKASKKELNKKEQNKKTEPKKGPEQNGDEEDDEIFDGEAEQESESIEEVSTSSTEPAGDTPETTESGADQSALGKDEATGEQTPTTEDDPPVDTSSVRTLDVITIIGNQEKLERASGSAFKVSGKTLANQEHDDVHRVLKQVPGVYIRDEDGFGLRPNIGLRGASSDRSAKVSLMEDGVLMAPAPYAAPAAYYFPLTTRLNGMEVFKGPSAIKYGPNTIGGALNFTTRPSIARGSKGGIDLAMGSFGAQKVHVFFGQGISNFGYVLEGARIDSDGFKDLDNGADTGFKKDDWMLKTHVQGSTGSGVFHRLELKVGLAREHSHETYLGLTDADFEQTPYRRYAASQLGDMSWERTQVKLQYRGLVGEDLEWNVTLYRHDFHRAWRKLNGFGNLSGVDIHDAVLDPTNPRFRPYVDLLKGASEWTGDESERLRIGTNDRTYISQGIQSKFEITHRAGAFRNTLELGVRAHQDQIKREHTEAEYDMISGTTVRATEDAPTRRNTGEAIAFSGHIFDEISWKEYLILSPGLRIERYEMALTDRLNQTPSATNQETVLLPGVGIWGRISDSVGMLAGVHKGFSPVSPGQAEDTKSETSLNYEAGLRWQFEHLKGEVVGFFNQYENLTGTCTQSSGCDPDALDEQFNAGRADILGVETVLNTRLHLGAGVLSRLQGTYTWTQAQFQSAFQSGFSQWGDVERGDLFPYVPQHQASIGLGLDKGSVSLDVNATYVSEMRDVAGQGSLAPNEQIPAHKVVDLVASYTPHQKTKIYLKFENVLNEAYMVSRRPFGARPGKPQQLIVGFKQGL